MYVNPILGMHVEPTSKGRRVKKGGGGGRVEGRGGEEGRREGVGRGNEWILP